MIKYIAVTKEATVERATAQPRGQQRPESASPSAQRQVVAA